MATTMAFISSPFPGCCSKQYVFFLCLFVLISCLLYRATRSLNSTKCHHLPPGPSDFPPFLTFLKMIPQKPRFRWILALADGNDITCICLATTHLIVVNSPELARQFLVKHDAFFVSRPITMCSAYLSRGFLSLATVPWGGQWVKMRRVVASELMSPNKLKWTSCFRVEEADYIVRFLYRHCTEMIPVVNVRNLARYYTGNMFRRLLFGRRHFGQGRSDGWPGHEEVEHTSAAFTVLAHLYSFCVSDFVPILGWFDLDGHERVIKESVRVIGKYHDPIIEERVSRWRNDGAGVCQEEDLLDVMVNLKDERGQPLLTMEEIKAECADLFYGTIDNISNIVECALAEMLNQPKLLDKAVEELDRVVGRERLVQESDFPQLSYIKACAREALRLHPMAPFNVPHVAISDTIVSGYFIPKGSQVLLSRVGLGRNPKVWAQPLKFDPDRHLRGGSETVELAEPELRFISFSTGRRGCKGGKLGSLLTYMLLARLLHCFEWSLPPGQNTVDLSEEKKSLFLVEPLHGCAKPRLDFLQHI